MPNIREIIVEKGNWETETSTSSLGTFATNLFFTSSYCSASNCLSFTLFARERGFTATAVLLGVFSFTGMKNHFIVNTAQCCRKLA
jgi:hypothetical protein